MATGQGPASSASGAAQPAHEPRGYLYVFLSLHMPAVALGLGQGITTPVLPVLVINEFGVSVGLASLVFVANMLGGSAISIPAGYAIDRFGRRRVLLAGPLIIAGSALLIAFATTGSFALLLFYRFVGGWGQQMWSLSRLTVIADTGGRQRGQQITGMASLQRAGNLAGPLIGGFAAIAWGLQVPFVMHAAVAIVAVIPSFLLLRETAPDHVRPIAAEPQPARQSDTGAGQAEEDKSFSWRILLQPTIIALFTAQFLGMITRGGAIGGGTIFLYGVYAYGAGPGTLGVLSTSVAIAGIPLTMAAGFIMDRFGRKVTMVPGMVLLSAAWVFLAMTAAASLPFYAFVIGFVWMQLTASVLAGSMQIIGTDIAPKNARGRFFGVGQTVTYAGFMSNPLSFSVLTAISGFTAAFAFLAGTGFASALILAFLVRETLGRNQDP